MESVSGYHLTSNMDYSSLNMGKKSSINSSAIGGTGANPKFINRLTVQMAGASNSKLNDQSQLFLNRNSIINPNAMIEDRKSSV